MSRTQGAKPYEYQPLALKAVQAATVATEEELAKLAPKTVVRAAAERTPVMLELDKLVQQAYDFWIQNDKPQPFTKEYRPVKLPVASAEQAKTARFLARKSAQFLNHGIRFGSDTPMTDGRIVVSFCVTDKQERKADKNGNQE